ncbi:MAG TPA: TlpA disulfide reductase family protein [Bacteroidota bacterium]|nr:TlpA disulfide reductase family protein [Bacteroidota bacterium]
MHTKAPSNLPLLVAIAACLNFALSTDASAQRRGDTLSVGDEAPKFLLREAMTNEPTYLSDYCGKVLRQPWKKRERNAVVISFWASWCEPCKIEIPLLMRMAEEFKDKPVKIFLVNTRETKDMTEDSIRAVMKRRGYTLPCLLDVTGTVADRYTVRGLPMIVVVDKFGVVRKINRGYHENFHTEIAELLRELIQEDEAAVSK